MKLEITRLHQTIDAKDKLIYELKDRVDKLEVSVDDMEQYSRRANLRIQGIAESGTGEDARAKVLGTSTSLSATMLNFCLCFTTMLFCASTYNVPKIAQYYPLKSTNKYIYYNDIHSLITLLSTIGKHPRVLHVLQFTPTHIILYIINRPLKIFIK